MYTVNSIRNICLLGHSGSGKSALAESLLYMTGAIVRMGKNADGNTVSDFDPEETRRNISISTSVIPLEYKNIKINVLDTPGAFDFSGAVMEALRAADAAILVLSARADLPLPLWPSRQMLRIELTVYIVFSYSFREGESFHLGFSNPISDIIHEGGQYFNDYFHYFHKFAENYLKYCTKNKKLGLKIKVKMHNTNGLSWENGCFLRTKR